MAVPSAAGLELRAFSSAPLSFFQLCSFIIYYQLNFSIVKYVPWLICLFMYRAKVYSDHLLDTKTRLKHSKKANREYTLGHLLLLGRTVITRPRPIRYTIINANVASGSVRFDVNTSNV